MYTKHFAFAAAAALAFTGAHAASAADGPAKKPQSPTAMSKADKPDFSDAQILGVTDVANTGEVEQGNVAASRGKADSVKQFARMMIKEHTAAKQKGVTVAKQIGVTPAASSKSADVSKDGADVMKKLADADADDFDKTYLKAQIKEHENTLKLLDQDLMPKATTPQVKSMLTELKGHVEHHLSAAHSALDNLSK
jgi:putative membrane protein